MAIKSTSLRLWFYKTAFFCLAGTFTIAVLVTASYIYGLRERVIILSAAADTCEGARK